MSTFFHSAAMSLLSRTLQTLLSKYLSDVDVEGVALPSFSDSGWGVRLSNVKLRDGTKLMDLQGKPRHVKSRRPPQRKWRRPPRKKDETEKETESIRDENDGLIEEATTRQNDSEEYKRESLASLEQQTVSTENETDSETIATSKDSPQKKRSWFFSWYYGSSISVETNPPLVEVEEALEEDGSRTVSKETDALREACMPPSTGESGRSLDSPKEEIDSTEQGQKDDNNDLNLLPERTLSGLDESAQSHEIDEAEPPMILRLGRGGTIGILDVRLVGKTIHLMIEDAFLTVEAVRLAPNPTHGEDDEAGNRAAGEKPSKPKPPMPDPKTAGDRLLAESAIARIFSAIPNLLMRDIRVRVVIRDEVIQEPENGEEDDDFEYDPNDTVIELAIEMLSVTDGGDFLLNFVNTMDDDEAYYSGDESVGAVASDVSNAPNSTSEESNEFLTKRIRTGRGPEGGIVLKMFDAGTDACGWDSPPSPVDMWARDSWHASSEFVVLRCSGLDLLARIFLGTKKEIAISKNEWYSDDSAYDYNDDFMVDALLFGGVDHIAPGPQPPLPPMSDAQVAGLAVEETWANPDATTFTTDKNGIQSCGLPSSFHKVARGMYPKHCSENHLPCESCNRCWSSDFGSARPHKLDSSTPLGGLVFHLSLRDPLEINVDRHNLEVLGLLLSLFSKARPKPAEDETDVEKLDEETSTEIPSGSLRSVQSDLSRAGSFSSDRSRRSTVLDHTNRSFRESSRSLDKPQSSFHGVSPQVKKYTDYDIESSFPTYMQPEKIQILGIHLSELKFRVHVMKEAGEDDDGLSYCYWDLFAKCVTFDHHILTASERPFQDLRLDIGNLKLMEYKGVERKHMLSLGVKQRVVDFDDLTVETFMNAEKKHSRPPWPTTAAAMLDVPPPLESLVFEERDRHGLQLRYSTVLDPDDEKDRLRKDANLRVGAGVLDVPWGVWNDLFRIVRLSKESILGPPPPPVSGNAACTSVSRPIDSVLRYKITAEGGRFQMFPLIKAKAPLTNVEGEMSPEAGFSVQGLLDKIAFGFGNPSPTRALDQGLSLHQLAKLPDNVRLRVLLFLKDLKPLETALGLPPAANSFLRCRAVNKGIVKVSKKVQRKMGMDNAAQDSGSSAAGKRQVLISELLALEDETLEDLIEAHHRNQRRNSGKY